MTRTALDRGSADNPRLSVKERRSRRSYVENPDYVAFLLRCVRRLGDRIAEGDPEDLSDLRRLETTLEESMAIAVTGLRATGRTDAEIGVVLGVTKQAVAKRWPRTEGNTS